MLIDIDSILIYISADTKIYFKACISFEEQ